MFIKNFDYREGQLIATGAVPEKNLLLNRESSRLFRKMSYR
jgi:hypothetical protein